MKKYQFLATALFIPALWLVPHLSTQAAMNVTGWAWSPNIGWISLSSTNPGIPATDPSYGVKIATSSADSTVAVFSGYGWAPNIGWISFNANDVTTCPVDQKSEDSPVGGGAEYLLIGNPVPGKEYCTPRIALASGKVSGWARVMTLSDPQDGGGWLHLSGINHMTGSDGLTYDPSSGNITGYAYEQGTLGWVNFMAQVSTVQTPSSISVVCTVTNPATPRGSVLTLSSAGNVTYSISASGGNGIYTYNWGDGAGYVAQSTHTKFFSATGDGPNVQVKDSNGLTSIYEGCQGATVNTIKTYEGSSQMKLLIGQSSTGLSVYDYDDTSPIGKSYQIVQGNKFAIRWNVNTPAGYTDPSVDVVGGSFAQWNTAGISNNGPRTTGSKDFTEADSLTLNPGKYKFTLTFTNPFTFESVTSSVNLTVIKSSLIHF